MPKKSWYGLVTFNWVDGEWIYAKDLENAQVTVNDMKGNDIQLKTFYPPETKKMLGVFFTIDGNNKTKIKHMRSVAEKWYYKVRVDHLTRFDTWTVLNTTVMTTYNNLYWP